MKPAAFVVAAVALSACSPSGPTRAQAETALRDYFATPHTGTADVSGGALRGAALTSLGACSAMGPRFTCKASFAQKGAPVSARLTIVKRDNGWFVESLRAG